MHMYVCMHACTAVEEEAPVDLWGVYYTHVCTCMYVHACTAVEEEAPVDLWGAIRLDTPVIDAGAREECHVICTGCMHMHVYACMYMYACWCSGGEPCHLHRVRVRVRFRVRVRVRVRVRARARARARAGVGGGSLRAARWVGGRAPSTPRRLGLRAMRRGPPHKLSSSRAERKRRPHC